MGYLGNKTSGCLFIVCAGGLFRQLFAAPWTVACQFPLSMGFPRQEYWSGLPFPAPGDSLDPGILALHTVSLPLSHQGTTRMLYAF